MVVPPASRRKVRRNPQEDEERYWVMLVCRGLHPTAVSLTALLMLELEEGTKNIQSQTAGLFLLERQEQDEMS